MAVLKNRAKMSTSATGTGSPITLGSAENGYQTFADAGVADADVVRYVIQDGNHREIGTGTYTATGTTLSRTVSESSNSDAAINLSGSATVFIGATAEDIPALYAANPSSATDPVASGTNAVAIGDSATATNTHSHAMGYGADATGLFATAVGYNALASGSRSVAIGDANSAGTASFAAGIANSSTSYGATANNSIAMGQLAKATAVNSVAIGLFNTAQATLSAAIGASNVTESTASSSFALGLYAKATIKGQKVHASGRFASTGDAQGSTFILRANTTDATATALSTNANTASTDNQIVAASDTCITFDGTITAMQNGAQAYASWKIEGLLVNDGGTTTLANSATTVIQNLSSWGMALSADNTNNALAITCTGEAGHNIRWVANIRTTEVTYA